MSTPPIKTIYICSYYEGFRPFEITDSYITKDFLQPFHKMKEILNSKGYSIKYLEDLSSLKEYKNINSADAIFYFDIPISAYKSWFKIRTFIRTLLKLFKHFFNIKKDHYLLSIKYGKNVKKVLFMFESKAITPENFIIKNHNSFDKILTFHDDFFQIKNYLQQRIPVGISEKYNLSDKSFHNKKFLVMINANKKSRIKGELYSERLKIANYFAKISPKLLDIYGNSWGNHPCSKGQTNNKIFTLSEYKFCICFENFMSCNGYVTEKIFDCFKAKVVPIYFGAPNIEKIIPENCYIDKRKFKNNEELFLFLQNISEKDHIEYLKNIETFLKSKEFSFFSSESFVQNILKVLE